MIGHTRRSANWCVRRLGAGDNYRPERDTLSLGRALPRTADRSIIVGPAFPAASRRSDGSDTRPSFMSARYAIGIDLGTTNCAVSYIDLSVPIPSGKAPKVHSFGVPQLVTEGNVADKPL